MSTLPAMLNEIVKSRQRNSELMKVIEENEIHSASLVHELRNPLNSLMGTITLLEKSSGMKNYQTQEIFSMAKSCGDHLHTLISNLLEYSKLKAKKVEINKTAFDLKNIIKRILKMNYLKSQEKQNKICYYISHNFPKKVVTDEQRINQILINLVSNALKFTDKGSVSVYLGWRPGQQKVETQEYQESLKSQPLQYIEQRHLFKAFTEYEDETPLNHYNSNDSLSEQPFQFGQNNQNFQGPGYNTHLRWLQENDLERAHSQFEFDNESARNYIRSNSDQRVIQQNQSQFNFQGMSNDDSFKNVKSEKNVISNPYQIQINQTSKSIQQVITPDQNFLNTTQHIGPEYIEEKKSLSSGGNNNFIKEVDAYLLGDQEEFYSDDQNSIRDERRQETQMENIRVKGELNLKNLNLEDSENQDQLKGNNVEYGTPRDVGKITEKQRQIIDIVVQNHKRASALVEVNQINDNIEDIFPDSNREDSNRLEQTLNSFKEVFDKNEFTLKFIHANSIDDNSFNQDEQKEYIQLIKDNKLDDNQILEKSILQYKKHKQSPPKKKSSNSINFNKVFPAQIQKMQSDEPLMNTSFKQEKSESSIEDPQNNSQKSPNDDSVLLHYKQLRQAEDQRMIEIDGILEFNKNHQLDMEEMKRGRISSLHSKKLSMMDHSQFQDQHLIDTILQKQDKNDDILEISISSGKSKSNPQEVTKKNQFTPFLGPKESISKSGLQMEMPTINSAQQLLPTLNNSDKSQDEPSKKRQKSKKINIRIVGLDSQEDLHKNPLQAIQEKQQQIIQEQQQLQQQQIQAQDLISAPSENQQQPQKHQDLQQSQSKDHLENEIQNNYFGNGKFNLFSVVQYQPDSQWMTSQQHQNNLLQQQNQKKVQKWEIQVQPIHVIAQQLQNQKQNQIQNQLFQKLQNQQIIEEYSIENQNNTIKTTKTQDEEEKELEMLRQLSQSNGIKSQSSVHTLNNDTNYQLNFVFGQGRRKSLIRGQNSFKVPVQNQAELPPTRKKKTVLKIGSLEDNSMISTHQEPAQIQQNQQHQQQFYSQASHVNMSKSAPTSVLQIINQNLVQQQSSQIDDAPERSNTVCPQSQKNLALNLFRFSTLAFTNNATSQSVGNEITTNTNINYNYHEKGVVEIKVRDSGIGISENGLKKLFQPYMQADKVWGQYGGTGLGLCICSELVQMLNGKIEVKSTIGQGTEFIVSIPIEVSADLTNFIDDNEFEKEINEIDLSTYEFIVCNNEKSFGINQMKKIFAKKQCNIHYKDPKELMRMNNNQDFNFKTLFQHEKTYKAFIIDYNSVRQMQPNLLQFLSNQNDTLKIDNALLNSTNNLNTCNDESSIIHIQIKVPVIVLISGFMDESKVKKSDNVFVIVVPFDARQVKRILFFLKRYYMSCINQYRLKNQQGLVSKVNSKDEISNNDLSNKTNNQNDPINSGRSNQQSSQIDDFCFNSSFQKQQPPQKYPTQQHISQETSMSQIKSQLAQHSTFTELQRNQNKDAHLNPQQFIRRQGSSRSQLLGMDQFQSPMSFNVPRKTINIKGQSSLLNQIRETDQDMETVILQHQPNSANMAARLYQDQNFVSSNSNLESQGWPLGDLSPEMFSKQFLLNSTRSIQSRGGEFKLKRSTGNKKLSDKIPAFDNEQYALVVNDDQFSLKITSMLLEVSKKEQGKQFTILQAQDGKEAVELYKTVPQIKLILMDIEMRIMDGYEATKRIREYEDEIKCDKEGCKMTYIIGVSGNSTQQHFRQCQNVGMNEAVIIPINNKKIADLINNLF